jgi:hypothetical protein
VRLPLNKKTGCYIYAYLRSESSEHGEVGSFYYIGKGKHGKGFYARAFDTKHSVHLPKDRSNVVILADEMTDHDARQAEMLLIFLHGRIDLGTGCLRNLTDGGEGCEGRIVTEETRAKMSKSGTGKYSPPWTEERKARASIRFSGEGNPFYGKTHSEEATQKISKTHKGRKISPEIVAKALAARMSSPKWEESKKRSAQSRIGHLVSAATRQKISEAHKGKRVRDDIKDSELIRLYTDGLSCGSIASLFNTTRSTISWRLREIGAPRRPSGFQKRLVAQE